MTRRILEDLADAPNALAVSCDVCIVGAGAAGTFLTRRLWERGLDVVLLEAGGNTGADALASGFEPEFAADDYPGATAGRFFGLGGSTSAWGGLLIPHSRHDLRMASNSPQESAWRHIVEVADRCGGGVLRCLGFRDPPDFDTFASGPLGADLPEIERAGWSVTSSVFLPFRKKNLFHLLERGAPSGPAPRIYTHAVAKEWETSSDGVVTRLAATCESGTRLEVRAKHFVIAAGAIESARILLEVQSATPSGISLSPSIGARLGDHLSVAIADVDSESLPVVTGRYAPRFSGPWMRSFRFMEASPPDATPRAFAHFVFENRNPGFELAKKVLTSLQARRLPAVSLREATRGVGGVVSLASDRFLRSRLFVPPHTATRLQLDVEQIPDDSNRVQLSDSRDSLGRRRVRIDWRIRSEDMEQIEATSQRLLAAWEQGGLPRLTRRPLDFASERPHDAYHPVGVCRMGSDPDSVVDLELRVRGTQNLRLVSTAALPSAGTANPTFTMLCLAEDLVERLAGAR